MSHHHTYTPWGADTRFERCVSCGTVRRVAASARPLPAIVDEVDADAEETWAQVTGQFQALGWDVRVTRVTRSGEE